MPLMPSVTNARYDYLNRVDPHMRFSDQWVAGQLRGSMYVMCVARVEAISLTATWFDAGIGECLSTCHGLIWHKGITQCLQKPPMPKQLIGTNVS